MFSLTVILVVLIVGAYAYWAIKHPASAAAAFADVEADAKAEVSKLEQSVAPAAKPAAPVTPPKV